MTPHRLAHPAPPEGRAPPLEASPPRVLVCDDSPAMRALVREVLGPAYDVRLAETGEEAIALARSNPPDVALCDLVLPGIWGNDVLRVFRATPSLAPIPFVIFTSRNDGESRATNLEAGADDYLQKPIVPRELRARVASLVRLRRAMREVEARSAALERANERLVETQGALVRAERIATLGSLAAGLAHAVNNPLSYVKSGAAALAGVLEEVDRAARATAGPAPGAALAAALDEARAIGDEIVSGLRRIERIACDLRFMSGPGADDAIVSPEEAVRTAWDVVIGRVAAAVPRLEVRGADVTPLATSRALLAQALIALLEHAIEGAEPTGAVEVAIAEREAGVELAVSNARASGAAATARIVDPCALPTTVACGHGLGLAVAYGVVRGLGGELEVALDPDGGSRLVLWLPRRRAAGDA